MSAPSLSRLVFKTSRLAEFCSERELVNQTGHDFEDWPLVVLKELIDNALDAAEEAGVAPVIMIASRMTRSPSPTMGLGSRLRRSRTSSTTILAHQAARPMCSPTRGAQGNALKTLLAMPFALDGERGETTIESQGVAHRITFSIDPIRQEPRIVRVCEDSLVKSGTRIAVSWPISASSILDDAQADFLRIAEDYTWINPHLSLDRQVGPRRLRPCSMELFRRQTQPGANGGRPTRPRPIGTTRPGLRGSSPTPSRIARITKNHARRFGRSCGNSAACPGQPRRKPSARRRVRGGCRSPNSMAMARPAASAPLLDAMRKQSRPIKPRDLGIIGEAHLRAKFESAGAAPESFNYKKSEIEHDGVPYLAEAAFGYCPKGINERRIITGVNWSPAISGDPFRRLGDLGQSLGSILTKQRAGPDEPIITVLHLACPRIEYLDRGKSSVSLPS